MSIEQILNEEVRRHEFPVSHVGPFLAHAAVTALPRAAADAIRDFAGEGSRGDQEDAWAVSRLAETRYAAARLLGCDANEIALLGPTSLGLNMVASGLSWVDGDEVVFYQDDYPANVYPWLNLAARGVRLIRLQPPYAGVINWPLIEEVLTPRTKLVALASCHFLSGYRVNIEEIGLHLSERGVLFCVDGIQTLGAFPLSVQHVDFLSADSHKWMLGPCGAGLFYVKASRHDVLRPTLLGSWNVVSPQFIASSDIRFYEGSRRYEPGTLNLPGLIGMGASLKLLLDIGIGVIAQRVLELRQHLLEAVMPLGYRPYLSEIEAALTDDERSGILSLTHPTADLKAKHRKLAEAHITTSLRYARDGHAMLRFSPHFYNTFDELDAAVDILC
jgi:selenocysteine lyase/cysteine desulfurase